ncbi:MAG: hypothetical protein D6798_00690 [Deltaproteobacteria bacterium]|nr:MAG: hypothetical protein D6798_00690 [Deltaproteobacteria bacterium]
MKRFSVAVALTAPLAFAACGYDEDTFADDYQAALCDHIVSCESDIVAAYTDMGMDEATAQSTYDTTMDTICNPPESTGDDTGSTTEEECDFDPDAAKACVDGVATMSCDFWSTGTGLPEECSAVCG